MRKEYRLTPILLKEKLEERLQAGLDIEESDRILNDMIRREIIIEEKLDLSHLDYLGKTLEEFEFYMETKDIYVMDKNTYHDLMLAKARLDTILDSVEDAMNYDYGISGE